MAKRKDQQRVPGLPSLAESREQRRRAVVLGRVRIREAAPQFWLWTAVAFLTFGVIYWHWSERTLGQQKSSVMARQRAIAAGLSPQIVPLREKIEAWVLELGADWSEEVVATDLDPERLSRSEGIYLRLLASDAASVEGIERASQTSLHDGFTSCLFVREERRDPAQGTKCFSPSQCPEGELCNEFGLCSPPTQPFNLRLMYGALRILSPRWSDELHQASSDYQVRLFERDLDKVSRTDVKIAIDMVAAARYFTALLDELPEAGLPPVAADAGLLGRPELRVQGEDHRVRLGIWELASGVQVFRGRFEAGADFIPMGQMKTSSKRTMDAQQRQVNNCGIAADLRAKIHAARASSTGGATSPQGTAAAGSGAPGSTSAGVVSGPAGSGAPGSASAGVVSGSAGSGAPGSASTGGVSGPRGSGAPGSGSGAAAKGSAEAGSKSGAAAGADKPAKP